jgi:hypothetical protein
MEGAKVEKARPAAARRVSGVRGDRVEENVDQEAPAKANVAREDRRRVAQAVAGARGWGRRVRSVLWNAPCRSTPTATASSIGMN